MTNELAQRCEAASGADRELDCRIWCIGQDLAFETARQIVPAFAQWAAPCYTASIDAALTLADPQSISELMRQTMQAISKKYVLHIRHFDPETDGDFAGVFARHFVATALRARQEKNDGA